jgi:hypothetical protein
MNPAVSSPGAGDDANAAGDIRIDRLALRVAGLDEDAAHVLARLVALRLAPGLTRSAGLDSLCVQVEASRAELGRPELLAGHIAAEVGRALTGGEALR